jgi:hypothetical protein
MVNIHATANPIFRSANIDNPSIVVQPTRIADRRTTPNELNSPPRAPSQDPAARALATSPFYR